MTTMRTALLSGAAMAALLVATALTPVEAADMTFERALDVSSGKKGTFRWKFDPQTNKAWAGDVACCGVNNRGIALWKDKVISISLDGRLFAINKATGEKVWERKIANPDIGETLTLAPLIVRDVAIGGTAGGGFGIRRFIEGTGLNTREALWRNYTNPGEGEAG